MPRGEADYGIYQQQYAIAGMSDPGELAARLDSINVFDRRGFTIWQDNFEAPALRWEAAAIGIGTLPILSTVAAVSGIQSVRLVAVAGLVSASVIRRRFPLIRLGKIGAEFWVQGYSQNTSYLELALHVYDGTDPNYASLQINTLAGTISIVHDVGGVPTTTVVATNVYMLEAERYFLPIKLVLDMDNDVYTRLLVGDREFDLSAYNLDVLPASTDRYVYIFFRAQATPGNLARMYIDDFILTQNEP